MNLLQEIGKKYGTDKSGHTYKGITYLDIYSRYLDNIRFDIKVFVEIGVLNGSSLKMWSEYFPNAKIYGIDINPVCKKYESDRVEILIGDQNDIEFLNYLSEKIGSIDILLDDGSHITGHQINAFNILYKNIKKGGFYIIEDLTNSYEEQLNHHDLRAIWPGMYLNKPDDPLKNYRQDFNNFVQELIKIMDFHSNKNDIVSIHFHPMIVIFENCK